ncbi:MAG: hypothetical protein OEU93_09825 [Rubrivivax sp.]|nr:hypothetical protein [Rubrivivax sp.]MDH5339452.1 hypothetical protein [Rubrivivax sp.]
MRIRLRLPWRRRRPDDLPTASLRQRLLVALAAVVITVVIGMAMLAPQLDLMRHKWLAAQPKPCAAGQDSGCIGGTMPLIVLPASAPGPH